MLFNSLEFFFAFLPVMLAGFLLLGSRGHGIAACAWIALGSVFFYGYWAPEYLLLLLGSIAINYRFGQAIADARAAGTLSSAKSRLILAIVLNLAALAYFKYANFLVDNLTRLAGVQLSLAQIVLPIGISFFTFTQIAYLVDTYQGKVRERNPVHYLLFVTYFPHLIAGPILHHAEMMPQFRNTATFSFSLTNFLSGLTVFLIGLFKKVVLADGIQPYVGPVFDAPLGQSLTLVEAWGGALAYTLQLYFDFSGYSDMAVGLSRMFNIELPLNFNSPYKSRNITEFWRRWHMTLSRFLRDYLYIPLGGNRSGPLRRYSNLMLTMLLGGLWHGAGWAFVIWGGLHGFYLACNHGWQALQAHFSAPAGEPGRGAVAVSTLLTFLCVVVAWVFFRAKDFDHAFRVLLAMFDPAGLVLPENSLFLAPLQALLPGVVTAPLAAFGGDRQLAWIGVLLVGVWFVPNTQEIIAWLGQRSKHWPPVLQRPEAKWFALGAVCFWAVLALMINETRGVSEFIYFNF